MSSLYGGVGNHRAPFLESTVRAEDLAACFLVVPQGLEAMLKVENEGEAGSGGALHSIMSRGSLAFDLSSLERPCAE